MVYGKYTLQIDRLSRDKYRGTYIPIPTPYTVTFFIFLFVCLYKDGNT